jgi:hypothetical protein
MAVEGRKCVSEGMILNERCGEAGTTYGLEDAGAGADDVDLSELFVCYVEELIEL